MASPLKSRSNTKAAASRATTSDLWRHSAAVVTVSDRSSRGLREDRSGPRVAEFLAQHGIAVVHTAVVADEMRGIVAALRKAARRAALVLTTGGTGFGPRDVTPEATLKAIERLAPGLSEAMRAGGAAREPRAWLSRGVAGLRGRSLIVNLPGSPNGAVESLACIVDLLPHALDVLSGADAHGGGAGK